MRPIHDIMLLCKFTHNIFLRDTNGRERNLALLLFLINQSYMLVSSFSSQYKVTNFTLQ